MTAEQPVGGPAAPVLAAHHPAKRDGLVYAVGVEVNPS
jgi:hypothetical protein